MDLAPGIEIIGTALFIRRRRMLILSDSHLGFEEALTRRGVMIPKSQFAQILAQLKGVFAKTGRVKTVVLNGDLKHEFGTILSGEWRDVFRLLDFLKQHCDGIRIVRGNHDTILAPIAQKRGIALVDFVRAGPVLIMHGDVLPAKTDAGVKVVIIGHEHPAVSIRDGARAETFKCFLRGRWRGRTLIVMPSTNPLVEGTNVMREKLLSPFLKNGVGNFEAFVLADTAYYFGRVRDLP